MEISFETLRIPRGLWKDLEDTIIESDKKFLEEISRTLGLNKNEVFAHCGYGKGGGGERKSIPCCILGIEQDDSDEKLRCPWYSKIGHIWEPCIHLRMSESTPCPLHIFTNPSNKYALRNSPFIQSLPVVQKIFYNDDLYWVLFNGKQTTHVFREDGTLDETLKFRWIKSPDRLTNCLVRYR